MKIRKKKNLSPHLGVEVEFEGLAPGATKFACNRTAAFAEAPD